MHPVSPHTPCPHIPTHHHHPRSYKRKLSAMKALKAATTLSPAVVQGAGIPGTNKYNAER